MFQIIFVSSTFDAATVISVSNLDYSIIIFMLETVNHVTAGVLLPNV